VLADLDARPPENAPLLEREAADQLWMGLPPVGAWVLVALFLALWASLVAFRDRLLPSRPCTKCGAPASRRYDAKQVPTGVCSGCYSVLLDKSARVDAGMRRVKDNQIAAYRKGRLRASRVVSLLFAGGGHVLGDAPIIGVLVATTFAFLIGSIVAVAGPVPWPDAGGTALAVIASIALALLALVVYVASFLTAPTGLE
jgi:hypothetical protein